MSFSFAEVLPIAVLGGILGLDVVSFPQAMISRPLVAATLGGALIGDAMSGLLVGAALELIALETLPFGAAKYPEWGSAAAVGGALFAGHPSHPAGAMTMAVIAAIATGWIGAGTMYQLRRLNAHQANRHRGGLESGARGTVIGIQLTGLSLDLLRGALLAGVAYTVFRPLMTMVIQVWDLDGMTSRSLVVGVAASVAMGAAWKLFHSVPWARWTFLAGLGIGLLVLVTK
ncbi:MAG TPA: PTS sugar transporter subunit IIC [Gemmatimonadaceae bacterium]|nr:PTS sugar transporter subunit IIC [Gemmatimonadaceae bacterium]